MRSSNWIGLGTLVVAAGCGGGGGGGGAPAPEEKSWRGAEFVAAFAGLAGMPQAAALPNGEIVAILSEEGGPIPGGGKQTEIRAYHLQVAGASSPVPLASGGHDPFLASDRKGNLDVFWEAGEEQEITCSDRKITVTVPHIFHKSKDTYAEWDAKANRVTGELRSGTFSGTSQQAQNTGVDAQDVSAARNAAGNVVAVWKQIEWRWNEEKKSREVTALRLYGRRYDPNSPGSPQQFRLSSGTDPGLTQLGVILHDSGTAVVVWTEDTRLYAAFLDSIHDLQPSQMILLDDSLDYSSLKNELPIGAICAAAGPKHVLVLWGSPSGKVIRSARLDVSTRSLGKTDIVHTKEPRVVGLALAGDGTLGATAVWSQYDDTGTLRVCSRRFDFTSGSWSGSVEKLQEGGGDGRFPAIAMNSAGAALTAWGEDNASLTIENRSITLSYNLYGRTLSGGAPSPLVADAPLAPRIVFNVVIDEAGNGAALLLQLRSTSSEPVQFLLNRYR